MNQSLKYKVIRSYCIIFYVLMIYKFCNGLFLFQLQPSFFYLREDIFTWVFMQTGMHQWLLNNAYGCILFDILFYSAPVIYFVQFKFDPNRSAIMAIIMLVINWCYVQCYTLYPSNSIEGHIAWLLFPIIFIPSNPKTFALLFDGLRYFFLFFFISAGLWKFYQGGIFNPSQMSGILLYQHKEMLVNSPAYSQTIMIQWLIEHQKISYLLYLLLTVIELSFIIGFFTKKFDKILLVLFLIFLLTDHLVMRITYYEVTPLLLTLYYSFRPGLYKIEEGRKEH
ncbi:MAG: hypothetical protein ACTHJ5_13425 [Ilyomonas sp.]